MSKFTQAALMASALIIAMPAFSRDKKTAGEIPNPRALAEVQSYCINKSELSGWDRHIVEDFVKSESKPKHLLTKLPWKLVENCRDGNPDATATLEFVSLNVTHISNRPSPPITVAQDPDAPIKAVLTVGDTSTEVLLYRAQAMPMGSDADAATNPEDPRGRAGVSERRDAVYHVFWSLINDLQAMRASRSR